MPAHWTYRQLAPAEDLQQGDIFAPTVALRAVLADVHPHFCDDKYLGFLAATQTCDLVRRSGRAKASYLSLAVIRPLAQVIDKLIGYAADPVGTRAFRRTQKRDVRLFMERLFNQNEQATGLFFLYPDQEAGLAESAVAFLRVTVSLRAEHYPTLVAARTGGLQTDFQAKLGWLIGNLYGRPATQDWSESAERKVELDRLIREALDEVGPRWIDDEIIEPAAAAGIDVGIADMQELELLRSPTRMERALVEIAAELRRIDRDIAEAQVVKLQNRLRNNGKFKRLWRVAEPAD